MKNKYIIYFYNMAIIVFVGLYIIDIPSPSEIITEKYNLELSENFEYLFLDFLLKLYFEEKRIIMK